MLNGSLAQNPYWVTAWVAGFGGLAALLAPDRSLRCVRVQPLLARAVQRRPAHPSTCSALGAARAPTSFSALLAPPPALPPHAAC